MFSVVIVSKDSEQALAQTLRSVRNQVYPPREIIVVERGNQSREQGTVRGMGPTVRVVRAPGAGAGEARRIAADLVTGSIVVFLDAPDQLLPLALNYFRDHFHRWSDCVVCYGRAVLRTRELSLRPSDDRLAPTGAILPALVSGRLLIQPASVAVRREALVGRRIPDGPENLEAIHLVLRLAARYDFGCVQEDVVIAGWPLAGWNADWRHYRELLGHVANLYREQLPPRLVARAIAEADSPRIPEEVGLSVRLLEKFVAWVGPRAIGKRWIRVDSAHGREELLRIRRAHEKTRIA